MFFRLLINRANCDALRLELLAHSETAGELLRTRALLDDTQRRLEAAERLLAQTSRRRSSLSFAVTAPSDL